jgi:hypothetical protein
MRLKKHGYESLVPTRRGLTESQLTENSTRQPGGLKSGIDGPGVVPVLSAGQSHCAAASSGRQNGVALRYWAR